MLILEVLALLIHYACIKQGLPLNLLDALAHEVLEIEVPPPQLSAHLALKRARKDFKLVTYVRVPHALLQLNVLRELPVGAGEPFGRPTLLKLACPTSARLTRK